MANKIHEGRNIKSFREMLSIKQEALATELGGEWTQKKISQLEAKEEVEPELVQRIAKALNIPEKFITDFNGDTANIHITNVYDNTVSENGLILSGSSSVEHQHAVNESTTPGEGSVLAATIEGQNNQYTFNPMDKVVELIDKLTDVYERLLESEKEKAAIMKAQLDKQQ